MMEAGTPPWRTDVHSNALTKKRYESVNALQLSAVASRRGFKSRLWATYKQWGQLGLNVKRRPDTMPEGEWGTKIVVWRPFTKNVDKGDIVSIERFSLMKPVVLFNADQVFGREIAQYRINETTYSTDYSNAEKMIASTGAIVKLGNYKEPHYKRPPDDFVCIPWRKRFVDDRQFYNAKFHELIHWSEWRTGWSGPYEMGELAAEIGAATLEGILSLPPCTDMTNYNKYLPTWLSEINKNPKYLFDAASQASKAVRFVLHSGQSDEGEDDV